MERRAGPLADRLDAVLEGLLEHYRVHAPVRATELGDTSADHAIDDWGPEAVATRLRDVERLDRQLSDAVGADTATHQDPDSVPTHPGPESVPTHPGPESVPTHPGPESVPTHPGPESVPTHPGPESVPTHPGDRADAALLADELAGLRHELAVAQLHLRDPRLYLDVVAGAVGGLQRPDATPGHALAARLDGIPRLLAQARTNLEAVSEPHRDAALARVDRVTRLIEKAGAGPSAAEAADRAARALHAWAGWLEQTPATGPWRAGEDGWQCAARAALGVEVDAHDLSEHADAALSAAGADAERRATDLDGSARAGRGVVDRALAALTHDRPPRDELLGVAANLVSEVVEEVAEGGTFPPPAAHPLRIEAVAATGGGLARLRPPPPLDPTHASILEVAVPDDPEAGTVLGAGDVHALRAAALHEVYPGHHLHVAYLRAHERRVRRVLRNPVLVEGWALYAERTIVRRGVGNPKMRLAREVMDCWGIAEALVDLGLHTRGWDADRAERLLVERAHVDPPRARATVRRARLDPARRSVYAIGGRLLGELRATWPYSDTAFHTAVLEAGAPPPRALPPLLQQVARRGG
ncbi:DUF885 family protein [Egibacter rhizosphaerae]|uniref:DUF885 family protein n=1 Tax=Egibacter rhizosphaerae TaxID=1670831 RepID=A0A411YCQ4_9ACTN|nr:DUF885 family protein [Egibacter rhizosphaerae]QBI18927.1 DUF885 family protein [Egibacter rhizosphaerae]